MYRVKNKQLVAKLMKTGLNNVPTLFTVVNKLVQHCYILQHIVQYIDNYDQCAWAANHYSILLYCRLNFLGGVYMHDRGLMRNIFLSIFNIPISNIQYSYTFNIPILCSVNRDQLTRPIKI